MPASKCPHCGHLHDGAFNQHYARPEIGDYTICVDCLQLNKFGPNFVLTSVDLVELTTALNEPEIIDMLAILKEAKRRADT